MPFGYRALLIPRKTTKKHGRLVRSTIAQHTRRRLDRIPYPSHMRSILGPSNHIRHNTTQSHLRVEGCMPQGRGRHAPGTGTRIHHQYNGRAQYFGYLGSAALVADAVARIVESHHTFDNAYMGWCGVQSVAVKGGADRRGTALHPPVKVGRSGRRNTRNAAVVINDNTCSVSMRVYSLPRLDSSSMVHAIDKIWSALVASNVEASSGECSN
mmetsp:Transcript_31057/g.53978  ORF Transcript_31057/g.53978 Transcript_31057/m.53978 type:complete len:212 (+) Transcript_31057:922-1557(+)